MASHGSLRISLVLLLTSLFLCASPLAPSVRATGSIWTVNDTGDSGTTTCTANAGVGGAICQLRDALGKAADGDTITFSVTGTIGIGANGTLTVAHNVTIAGPASGPGVQVDGGHSVQVFAVTGGVTASISNLTIANGSATNQVGGVTNSGTLTLTNCTLTGNQDTFGFGGAIYNVGTLIVSNSIISGNSTVLSGTSGGGIYNHGGMVTVTDSTFSGNSAAYGGGIHNEAGGTMTVSGSTFTGNTARSQGAGFFNIGGTLIVTNSTVSGNMASSPAFTGGIYNTNGTATVTNSTVVGNVGGNVSGIQNDSGTLNLTNTIVSGNTGGPDLGGLTAPAVNSHTLIGGDPLLAPLSNYGGPTRTMSPLPGSPAIDAGDDTACAATGPGTVGGVDQRGIARTVHGAHCDIGAVESQGFGFGMFYGDNQTATVNTTFAPLVVIIGSAFGEPITGGVVSFTNLASGAGIQGAPLTVTIGASGNVSATPAANGTAGTDIVTASAAGTTPLTFTLHNAPLLSGLSPAFGGDAGGNRVTLAGAGFGTNPAGVQVLVGGTAIPAGSIVSVTDTHIVYMAPAHTSGDLSVSVTVAGVAAATSMTYTYGAVTSLPSPKPSGSPVGSSTTETLPSARPAGSANGANPSPLPAPRP